MNKSLRTVEKSLLTSFVRTAACLSAANSEAQNFVNGRRCLPVNYTQNKLVENVNPATGKLVGKFYESDCEEVHRAVDNAKESFHGWSQTTASERSNVLQRAAKLLTKKKQELSVLETIDTGELDVFVYIHYFTDL